jgi:hemoglobin-like flavoprotein
MNLDVDTIETTFDLVAPRSDELMDVFSARLCAAAPVGDRLFAATDSGRQKAILQSALALVRESLRDTDALVAKLREMGERHVADGATTEHYIVAGEALIASLAEIAGEAWRPEHELAWGAALAVIAHAMVGGEREVELDLAA